MSDANKKKLKSIGEYNQLFNELLGMALPCGPIYQSEGLIRHIKKRHPDYVAKMDLIPDIIANPDYIGKPPAKSGSIEIVKIYDEALLVAVTLDIQDEYLYVASLYPISMAKVARREKSGRIVKFEAAACKEKDDIV